MWVGGGLGGMASSKAVLTHTTWCSNGGCPKASISDHPPASRVLVRNLSYSTTETSLRKSFSDFGKIVDVKLARDEETKKSKGFAFIQYSCQDDAITAIEHMDRKAVDGRFVHVEIAKPTRNHLPGYPRSMGPPIKELL